MKKILNNRKMKFLLLLPSLLLITGCASETNSDYVGSCDTFSFGCMISEQMNNFKLSITSGWWGFIFGMQDLATGFANGLTKDVFSAFTQIEAISKIISISSTIGIVFIFIKYAWAIFRYYSIQLDEGISPLTIEFIKKTAFAMLFVFLAPYIIINGFYLTTVVTSIATTMLNSSGEVQPGGVNVRDALDKHVDLGTWCGPVAYDNDEIEEENNIAEDGDKNIVIKEEIFDGVQQNLSSKFVTLWGDKDSGGEEFTGKIMNGYYQTFCARNSSKIEGASENTGGTYLDPELDSSGQLADTEKTKYEPINVYVAIMHSPDLLKQVPSGGFLGFANMLIAFFFGIFTTLNVGIRIAELIVLIMMTPFFGMQYISVKQSEALATWSKELMSIFMSHAVTILLFQVYLKIAAASNLSLSTIPILFGLLLIQVRGPSALRAWSHNTGSAGVANGIRKAMSKNG